MNTEKHDATPGIEEMEARLWAYIDGMSEEPSAVETLLAENRLWKEKYAELLEVHGLMASGELDEPSMRFTRNVMEEIARYQIAPATRQYINNRIIWSIAAFFITVIVGFLIYGLSQVNWSAAGSDSSPLGIDFAQVDYSGMFNSTLLNGFMLLNVVLGLFLLDRYLGLKRKQMMEGKRGV